MNLNRELLDLERGFWDAAGDGDFYRRHMAGDGLCMIPAGILDKDATVEAVARAEPWRDYEIDDVQVIRLDDDEIALLYEAHGTRGDGESYFALVSSIYTHRHGDWQLVLHHHIPTDTDDLPHLPR